MIDYAKLKGLMVERGLEVTKLAEILGISRQAASGKINGKSPISLTDAQVIAKALNMSKEERDTIFFKNVVKSEATL
ncbi:MAG: helix-turn-helix transcriptional regulator [Clostridiales bacterium]|nr:helix-turn-helix transcriptional regulator [Clostridiales bacterium]